MNVLITGGGGFLGSRLARRLLERGTLADAQGRQQKISKIVLFDTAFPAQDAGDARIERVAGDLSDRQTVERVVTPDVQSVFHLAAVVSGGAEADFDLGMRVNLDGTRWLFERLRACQAPPRLVFTSSVAAFGGPLPEVLDDGTIAAPSTSYGTQKVIGEYLIADFSRKGFLDGRALRLPTVVVRPGKPNAAASSFASSIIREPLNGVDTACPVSADTGVWLLSPRRVIDAFVHAHDLPESAWQVSRTVNLPGITASVREMVDAMGRIAGTERMKHVLWQPDPRIEAIVSTWPGRFQTPRALEMGFQADPDVDTVIRQYIEDENIRLG